MSGASCIVVAVLALSYTLEASVGVESSQNGTVLASWTAPYFVLGNTSFDVTANTLYIIPPTDQTSQEHLLPPFSNTTIVAIDSQDTIDYQGWADACSSKALSCRAMIVTNCAEPTRNLQAWMFRSTRPAPFTDVPMVIMTPEQTSELMSAFTNDGKRLLRITSHTAPDPIVMALWPRMVWTIAFLLSTVIVAVALVKLASFCVSGNGRFRRAPFAPTFAVSTIFLDGVLCSYMIGDIALCQGRCSSYNFSKAFLLETELAVGCIQILAIAYILQQACGPKCEVASRWTFLRQALQWSVASSIIIAYEANNIIGLVTSTLRSSSVYVAGALLMDLVAFVAFIRQGRNVTTLLLQCKGISDGDRRARVLFGRRIARCGIMGILVIALLIILAVASVIENFPLFWVAFSLSYMMVAVQRITEALAFQAPPDNIVASATSGIIEMFKAAFSCQANAGPKLHSIIHVANPQITSHPL
ncbi:Uncharacterized protein PBTT_10274 [Plasmodiophora brassicae]